MFKFFTRFRSFQVIRRIRITAHPLTLVAIAGLVSLKEFYLPQNLQVIKSWGIPIEPPQITLDELAPEEAKLDGADYLVNLLKTQGTWEPSTLLLLKRMAAYDYWCNEFGEKTNLLSYLIRNFDKMDQSELSRKNCIKLIHRLAGNKANVDKLFQEIPVQTLVEILNENSYSLFGSAVAYCLYRSPIIPIEFKSKFQSSVDFHLRRLRGSEDEYLQFLTQPKNLFQIKLSLSPFEPVVYIWACWLCRLLYFKKSVKTDVPIFLPLLALSTWSELGYMSSRLAQKRFKQRRKKVIDPTTPGSIEEKRTSLRYISYTRSFQTILTAGVCPFTFVASILGTLKRANIESDLTLPAVLNVLVLNKW